MTVAMAGAIATVRTGAMAGAMSVGRLSVMAKPSHYQGLLLRRSVLRTSLIIHARLADARGHE